MGFGMSRTTKILSARRQITYIYIFFFFLTEKVSIPILWVCVPLIWGFPVWLCEADGKCLCCSVVGNALGKCQFVVDTYKYKMNVCQKFYLIH